MGHQFQLMGAPISLYGIQISSYAVNHNEQACACLLIKGNPSCPDNALPDVIDMPYSGNGLNPTQKPTAILKPLIQRFSKPGDVILWFVSAQEDSDVAIRCDVTMQRKPVNSISKQSAAVRVPVTVRLPEKVVQQIDRELEISKIKAGHISTLAFMDSGGSKVESSFFNCDAGITPDIPV